MVPSSRLTINCVALGMVKIFEPAFFTPSFEILFNPYESFFPLIFIPLALSFFPCSKTTSSPLSKVSIGAALTISTGLGISKGTFE